MGKKNYKQQAMRNLRNADGTTTDAISVRVGLGKTFGFSIKNPSTTDAITVALIPGHYDTTDYKIKTASVGGEVIKSYSNPASLAAAGYPCDAVIDDGIRALPVGKGTGNIEMSAADPKNTIRSFIEYIKTNPMPLKGIRIMASDQEAFDGSITVASSSPFDRGAEKTIQLNDFVSAFQYQVDRISIDLSSDQLELSDITMLFAVIPAASTMKFFLKF